MHSPLLAQRNVEKDTPATGEALRHTRFPVCPMQLTISVCSPGLCYCAGTLMCPTVFRGFAEPESGLARWYKF